MAHACFSRRRTWSGPDAPLFYLLADALTTFFEVLIVNALVREQRERPMLECSNLCGAHLDFTTLEDAIGPSTDPIRLTLSRCDGLVRRPAF
jgi:hypothetical protein